MTLHLNPFTEASIIIYLETSKSGKWYGVTSRVGLLTYLTDRYKYKLMNKMACEQRCISVENNIKSIQNKYAFEK